MSRGRIERQRYDDATFTASLTKVIGDGNAIQMESVQRNLSNCVKSCTVVIRIKGTITIGPPVATQTDEAV
ncbi:MAG TPA: hypothetical protein VJP78_04405 [Thermoleophilia bacterium]|nr:hypothetical protein [Thermoleophilia bacterium]